MALFTDDGRHLGFLSLLTGDSRHRTASYGGLLASLRPIIVKALDRLPSFASAAQLTGDAVGGIAVTRAGRGVRIPGLPTHPLLGGGLCNVGGGARVCTRAGDNVDVSESVGGRAPPRQRARLPRRDGGPPVLTRADPSSR